MINSSKEKRIKIFLASSEELVDDRTAFEQFIYRKTKLWRHKNIFLELIIWEDFLDSISLTRKQDDYNRAIEECDIFVLLFFTKVGKYTEEEFDIAYRQFKATSKPLIFTYFKSAPIDSDEIDERVQSMLAFKERLSNLEHFYSKYKTIEGLQLHFSEQLDRLEQERFFLSEEIGHEWLNNYLSKVQDDFSRHMLQQKEITEESAMKAQGRFVELLVQERKQAKPTEREGSEEGKEQAFLFTELLDQENTRFLIFGDGGGGKTTCLRKLASDCAGRIQSEPSLPIPVFVKVNDFDSTEKSFDGLIRIVSRALNLESHKFEAIWRNGTQRFLFLLDGYNEVGDAFQEACAKALHEFLEVGTHYYLITSRPVDRAEQLGNQIDLITVLEVIRLEENQIKDFLARHGAAGLFEQMGDQLKGLAQNPFMLWALAQSSSGSKDELPTNIGQLYQSFIDQYIFVEREKNNKIPSPTEYNYFLVKKPVLANLAMKMNLEGVTKFEENQKLRKYLWDQLRKLRTENEGLVDFKSYNFMPHSPSAQGFLNETVHNDVLRRIGDTLEFMHQSVQDYFTATAIAGIPDTPMTALPIDEVIKLAPRLRSRYIRLDSPKYSPKIQLPDKGNFSEPLVMLSGMLDNPDDFLFRLDSRNSLIAARCAGAASNITDHGKTKLILRWQKVLRKDNPTFKCLSCLCFSYSKFANEEVAEELIDLIKNDSNEALVSNTAAEALGRIGQSDHIRSIVKTALSDNDKHSVYKWKDILKPCNSQIVVQELFDNWRDATRESSYRDRAKALLIGLDHKDIARAFLNFPDEMIPQIVAESIETEFEYKSENYYTGILGVLNVDKVIAELFRQYDRLSKNGGDHQRIQLYLNHLDNKTVRKELGKIIEQNISEGKSDKVQLADNLLENYTPVSAAEPLGLTPLTLHRIFGQQRELIGSETQKSIEKLENADFDEITEKLNSDNLPERIAAIRILGQSGDDSSFKYLLDYLPHVEYLIHYKNFGDHWEFDPLIEVLKGFEREGEILAFFKDNIENPTESLVHLTKILNEEVVPYLLKLLDDQRHQHVRRAVIHSLLRFIRSDVIMGIDKLLDFESDATVIEDCIELLGESRSEIAISPLLKVLKRVRIATWEHFPFLTDDSLVGISSSGSSRCWVERISPVLRRVDNRARVWQSLSNLFDESEDDLRPIILRCMAELFSDRQTFREILMRALKDESPEVRIEGIKFLYELNYQAIEQTLLELAVTDDVEEVRKAAVYVLRFREGDEILPFFLELLEGNEKKQKEYAIFSIGELKDEEASKPLESIFQQTDNPIIKHLAAEALRKIGNYEDSSFLIDGLWPFLDENNDHDIAMEVANLLLRIPKGREKLYAPIQEAMGAGNYNEVIKSVEDRVRFLPLDTNLYWWRGIAYHQLKMSKKALSDYDQALKLVSESVNPDVYHRRAMILVEFNRHEDALVDARKATNGDSERSDFQTALGWCAFKAGQYEESVAASTRALELDVKASVAAFNLGLALLVLERPSKARDAYSRGIKICEGLGSEMALANIGGALDDLDELVDARSHLKSSVEKCKDLLSKESKGGQAVDLGVRDNNNNSHTKY